MHNIPESWEVPARGCKNCDVADAVLAAYRHALKDIARGAKEDAQLVALKAMDNDQMNRLGKAFHTIVKYAVQLTHVSPDSAMFHKLLGDLKDYLQTVEEGATVRGWRGDVVKS